MKITINSSEREYLHIGGHAIPITGVTIVDPSDELIATYDKTEKRGWNNLDLSKPLYVKCSDIIHPYTIETHLYLLSYLRDTDIDSFQKYIDGLSWNSLWHPEYRSILEIVYDYLEIEKVKIIYKFLQDDEMKVLLKLCYGC